MRTVGIRQLSQNTSRIVQEVKERGTVVNITHHGKVVARLVPANEPGFNIEDLDATWAEIDQLAAEISQHAPKGKSAQDIINDLAAELSR